MNLNNLSVQPLLIGMGTIKLIGMETIIGIGTIIGTGNYAESDHSM